MATGEQTQKTQATGDLGKSIVVVEDDASTAEMLALLVQSETPYQLLC